MSEIADLTKPARTGPVRRFGSLHIFAMEGLICILDEKEDCSIITPNEAKFRIEHVVKPYRNKTPVEYSTDVAKKKRKMISQANGVLECVREAKDMGDPSDPAVQAFWVRQGKIRSVSFSNLKDAAGYPVLPHIKGIKGFSLVEESKSLNKFKQTQKKKTQLILPD